MLFSVTKVKTLCTQTLPSRLTQPKKILFHATHAYVFKFDEEKCEA